jgi:ethanolamine ammonia-lyase small subunit
MSALEPSTQDPWQVLRTLTDARIALGRAGSSVPTGPQLDFQWAHARARDAVHHPLDLASTKAALENLSPEVYLAQSAAKDRLTYLQRPDLGRRLDTDSRKRLDALAAKTKESPDLVIVIADGLSALAIERNAARFLSSLLPALQGQAFTLAPLILVQQGRVAIGDEIGEVLKAKMVAILIGERPGLSSPDSMGIYLSWQPTIGLQDSARNCLSNIRPQGLSDVVAVEKFMYLLCEATRRQLTGVALKDETIQLGATGVPQTQRLIL